MSNIQLLQGEIPGSYFGELSGVPTALLVPQDEEPCKKALAQLVNFSTVKPHGGSSPLAIAVTPDFHRGGIVPVGSVLATDEEIAIPSAVGNDSGCGMRLVELISSNNHFRLNEHRETLHELFLDGRRNIPMDAKFYRDFFDADSSGVADALKRQSGGLWNSVDIKRIVNDPLFEEWMTKFKSSSKRMPSGLIDRKEIMRDPGIGTLGSGNHFMEFCVIEKIVDRKLAWDLGIKEGASYVLVHTGSRDLGFSIGAFWKEQALKQWPTAVRRPEHGIFALQGKSSYNFIEDCSAACRYGWLNRMMLIEMLIFGLVAKGAQLESRLILDAPHNFVSHEGGVSIHRKGANAALKNKPVVIPGSMGDGSWICMGQAHSSWLDSCSHGSGRILRRGAAAAQSQKGDYEQSFECMASNPRRIKEEGPGAYRPVDGVVEIQEKMGLITRVARLKPILTIKA